MAATTPVIIYPEASVTGIKLDARLIFLKNPYSGAGTQREVRWRIYDDASRTTTLWDSLLTENDDVVCGDDWFILWPSRIPLMSGVTYYLGVLVRNTSDETSSESTLIAFTMETAKLTLDIWTRGG